jgi:hypothetical protein
MGSVTLPKQKMVTVVMGDNEQQALGDIEQALNRKQPIVIVQGSQFADELLYYVQNNTHTKDEEDEPTHGADKQAIIDRLQIAAASFRVVAISNDSEELACVVHLLLAISL